MTEHMAEDVLDRLDALIAREAWLLSEWPKCFERERQLKITRYAMRQLERELDSETRAAIMDAA